MLLSAQNWVSGIHVSFILRQLKLFIACSLIFFHLSVASQTNGLVNGKIPIDPNRWYQLNTTTDGLEALFDGDLYKNPSSGWSLIFPNWDAWYPVLPGEIIQIDKIRFYDWEGTGANIPMTVFAVDDQWQRIPIARFTGPSYDRWVGPYVDSPDVFMLNTPVKNVRYLVINTYGFFPSEIEFYGNYQSPALVPYKQPLVPLKNYFGINGFEWDLLSKGGKYINDTAMQLAKSFTGFRHYLDWDRLEQTEGSYTYNPVFAGNWNLDTMYQRCKETNIEVLACIKNMPQWMENTYPVNRRNNENVPVKFGKDFTQPESYIEQAKMAFQFAARYGANKNVNPGILSVNSTSRWTGDTVNTIKIGLNLVKYMECNNEPDKWWKGRDAYQSGREYAANLSAFYDGHKKTMGPGVGVKNADPTMKVVASGTAASKTDYVKGMIDWCKEFRGYLPDSSVNYCWDVMNYHFYSNDSKTSQNGTATRGVAPELGGFADVANAFVQTSHQFGKDMPVWITETGYDTKSISSTQYAIPIGNKDALQTQADWALRTSLLASRTGIDRLFFYEMFDDNSAGGQFGSSGFLRSDNNTRRPSGDYLYQVNQTFGNYQYRENIQHNPEVDRYELNGQSMYAIWMPTENGSTGIYDLNIGKLDSIAIYTPAIGLDSMQMSKVKNRMESVLITAAETPVFVLPYLHQVDLIDFTITSSDTKKIGLSWTISADSAIQSFTIEKMNETDHKFHSLTSIPVNAVRSAFPTYTYQDISPNTGFNRYRLKPILYNYSYFYSNIIDAFVGGLIAYPNPSNSSVNIQGLASDRVTKLKIVSMSGNVLKSATCSGNKFQWNISDLASGIYFVVAEDGLNTQSIKINKITGRN